ncbi:cytochrome P450 [Nocardia beijingensis]|uniref:cytochrome P450 family protein n=1 Tax=Nocardia beijingensis TaxID=95162 RepID=UPI001895E2AD|nr:cytochrome P450 [Nocardia beijingensis]MBF6466917.1 cytochrome P450 [Nocardia beijingensis]
MTESIIQLPTAGESVFQTYERIRGRGPVVPIELPGKVEAWLAVGHQAVSEILAGDGTLFSKNARNCPALHDGTIPPDWPLRALTDIDHLLNKDGDDHRRVRKTIGQAFTPGRVTALEPRIRQITAELIDGLRDHAGELDLVSCFTTPLPVRVICELFGVPADEQSQIRRWATTVVSQTSTGEETQAAVEEMLAYLTELLSRKRRAPGDDLTSALVQANRESRLSDEELVRTLWLVLIAGHETTVHLLGNAVIALCSHPAQLARATAEDRWPDVVEEILRFRSSACVMFNRYALQDVTIAGIDIPAGAIVGWYAGVGRDPQRHPNADIFDIDHDHRDQLAFGRGPHFCLGAPLARLEGRVALSMLFDSFPRLRLACDPGSIPLSPQFITCGPLALPVLLEPMADTAMSC